MDSWSRINNPLIAEVESRAVPAPKDPDLKNTLPTYREITDYSGDRFGPDTIHNNKREYYLGKINDNLAQMYIEVDIQVATRDEGFAVIPEMPLWIFSEIELRTRGSPHVVQVITPAYSQMRFDEEDGGNLEIIKAGITVDSSFYEPDFIFDSERKAKFIIPLYLFFSETTNTWLKTRGMEEMSIRLTTNSSAPKMGMTNPDIGSPPVATPAVVLASLTYKIKALFQDVNNANLNDSLLNTVKKIPKSIYGGYNIFREETTVIAPGKTNHRMRLMNPNPSFVIHAYLSNNTDSFQIKNMKIQIAGNNYLDLDYRMNYQRYTGRKKKFVFGAAFSYWWAYYGDRTTDSGLITCSKSDNMSPMFLELDFPVVPAVDDATGTGETTLEVFWEYRTDYSLDDMGNWKVDVPNSIYNGLSVEGIAPYGQFPVVGNTV